MSEIEVRDVPPHEGCDLQIGLLVSALQNARRTWRMELGEVPDEAINWAAYPGGHTIGGVMLHMADAESFWLRETARSIAADPEEKRLLQSEELDQYEYRWPVPPAKPLSWYIEIQDRIRARTLEDVLHYSAPDEQVLTWNGTYSTFRRLLAHVMQHESYHGGQLVLLKALWERRQS